MPPEQAAASGADSGSLSVDSAAALLMTPEPPRPDEAQDAPGADAGAADQTQDQEIPADEPTAEADEGAQPEEAAPADGEDEGEQEAGAAPPIAPPVSWDAEAKAVFAQLPAELQTKVAEIQAQRDRQTNEALQRAAETHRRAEAEVTQAGQLKAVLGQILPRAQQVFTDRWATVDWAAWAASDPGAAYQAEQQMKAEQAQLLQLETARKESERQDYQRFVQAEGQKLTQLAPDLADPEKGAARRQELKGFLNQAGFPDEVIGRADASMLAVAYDAMRFRALQAQARQQLGKRPTPPPARPGLRPTPPRPGNSQTREADSLNRRLSLTGKVDDAVALLLARG